jgi:SPP1 gp7 family putative phage head morphogenesis protein
MKRQAQLLRALEKDEETIKKRLARLYLKDAQMLEKEIALYYQKYGEQGVIEFRKLLESADPVQKEEIWKAWEDFAMKNPQYAHLTPQRENIYKLNRLEAEQESIRLRAMESAARDEKIITDHLSKVSERTRIGTAIRGGGFHRGLAEVAGRPGRVTAADMTYYSDAFGVGKYLIKDREKMAQYLQTDFAQGVARGDSYQRMAKALSERLQKVSRKDTYGIIYTEGTHVHAEASKEAIKEDFEEYTFSTYNDNKVCPICRALEDHGPFKLAEATAGVNFPPMHPYCRCRIEPHVSDWDKWMDDYVARHSVTKTEAEQTAGLFQ